MNDDLLAEREPLRGVPPVSEEEQNRLHTILIEHLCSLQDVVQLLRDGKSVCAHERAMMQLRNIRTLDAQLCPKYADRRSH